MMMRRHVRALVRASAAACALFVAASLAAWSDRGAAAADAPVHLTMFVFAAAGHMDVPEAVVRAYMQAHPNVKVDFVESSNAKTFPQQLAAFKTTPDKPFIDIGYYNGDTTTKGLVNDMWQPLDASKIPNLKTIDAQFRQPQDTGVEFAYGPFGLIYNKQLVKRPPTSYADMWANPAFQHKVVLWDYVLEPVMLAALFNGGTGTNIMPGFQVWSQHADQIATFIHSNQELENALVGGDGTLAFFDLQIATLWAKQGAPIGTAIPKEGAVAWPLFIEVTRGEAPAQLAVLYDLINQLISADTLTKYSAATLYVPTNRRLPLPANVAAAYPPGALKKIINLDWMSLAKNTDGWNQLWDTMIKAKVR